MASKRIIQYDTEVSPSATEDYVVIDKLDGTYRKVTLQSVANTGGLVTSVNGEQGIIELTIDDIPDGVSRLAVTDSEKDAIALIKTDQGAETFLNGSGDYTQPAILDAANIGTGEGILFGIVSSELQFKTLKPGTLVTLTSTSDEITINDAAVITYVNNAITSAGTSGLTNVYTGASPSTVAVGGVPAGTVLTGRSYDSLFEELFVEYLAPAFSSFSISGQSTLIQVGTTLSGTKTFTWATTNSSNVATNSILIRDVTANNVLASSLANDGTEAVAIGTIGNSSPMTRSWRVEGVNTNAAGFNSSNYSVSSIYPIFYGKVSGSRPSSDQTLIASGTESVTSSTGTLSITYSSSASEYIWFATPATSTTKTVWYVSALNNGSIGGSVDPGGNLFPAPDTTSIDSPTVLWSGVSYKIYVANYASAVGAIEFRNS